MSAANAVDMSDLLDAISSDGEWLWQTDEYHADNNVTMCEFLECYLPEGFEVTLEDGTYAEIHKDGLTYGVPAPGNGDPWHHRVEFSLSRYNSSCTL